MSPVSKWDILGICVMTEISVGYTIFALKKDKMSFCSSVLLGVCLFPLGLQSFFMLNELKKQAGARKVVQLWRKSVQSGAEVVQLSGKILKMQKPSA